jgi:hypothetical protein
LRKFDSSELRIRGEVRSSGMATGQMSKLHLCCVNPCRSTIPGL